MAAFDVVVVGGGLGGLMAAALIAKEGFSVQVLERASHVGGRALSPPVGALGMNLGAHALYAQGPAERVLDELGIERRGFAPLAREAWLADGDDVFASPTSVVSLASSRQFSFGERLSLARFFALGLGAVSEDLRTTAWLDGKAFGARARRFVDAMVRVATYSNAPDVLPAHVAARQLARTAGLRATGVIYLDDGWQSLVDRVEAVAKQAGVLIATESRVTSLEHLDAQHVVLALPRAAASQLVTLGPSKPSARAACLDMTIDGPVSKRLVFGLDEPHYFSVHSRDSEPAPLRAHAFRYLARDERGADFKSALEAWLARVVPDLSARVVARRFLPEMEVASALPSRDAAPPIEGISFVGDWTSAKFQLLDAVAESVEVAVDQIRRRPRRERKRVSAA